MGKAKKKGKNLPKKTPLKKPKGPGKGNRTNRSPLAGGHEVLTPEQVVEAILKCEGWIGKAAEMLEVTTMTIYNYGKKYPIVKAAIRKANKLRPKYAANKLRRLMDSLDEAVGLKATIYYLNQRGAKLGFGKQYVGLNQQARTLVPESHRVRTAVLSDQEKAETIEAAKRFLGWDGRNGNDIREAVVVHPGESDPVSVRSREVDGREDEGGSMAERPAPLPE